MAFAFSDLQSEVLRRATKNQGGPQFTVGIKNVINTSMWRVSREARWRSLRRVYTFNTVTTYTTGTGAVTATSGSKNVTVTGATFLTDDVRIGRFIKITGSAKFFKILTITGETTLTIDQNFDGTSTTTGSYAILPQGEYPLGIQIGHSAFLIHRQYGRPYQMEYNPAQEFFLSGAIDTLTAIPTNYRMWGSDDVLEQVKSPSVISISSSSSTDTNIAVTIFGIVSGYPDYEIITTNSTNGTTVVPGLKTFSSVERIAKNQNSIGRISAVANSASTTVGVLPVGNTTTGPMYQKAQIWPLPNTVFPIDCYYYKLPFQLINDGDVPEIGEDFSEAIILLAVCKLKAEQNQKEDVDFFKLYQDEIESLKKTNVDKLDWKPNLKRPGMSMNNLGLFTPAQTGGNGLYGWGTY